MLAKVKRCSVCFVLKHVVVYGPKSMLSTPSLNNKLETMEKNSDGPELFQNEDKFYSNAEVFWSQVPPTVDGVLGGFGCISFADIRGSDAFLRKLFNLKNCPGHGRALDCGAGIGRITKNLLTKHFKIVDLVEQNPKFVEAAKRMLSIETNVGEFYECGLQNFTPQENFYDVIWCQWVLGHLTDEDLVQFLLKCKTSLKENGVIVIKENIAVNDVVEDDEDSSVTRPAALFERLFTKAGLCVIRQCKQTNFPKKLFLVKIMGLRPSVDNESLSHRLTLDNAGNKDVTKKSAAITSNLSLQHTE